MSADGEHEPSLALCGPLLPVLTGSEQVQPLTGKAGYLLSFERGDCAGLAKLKGQDAFIVRDQEGIAFRVCLR